MKVTNLTSSRSGRPVANQFVIVDESAHSKRIVFQSYATTICSLTYSNYGLMWVYVNRRFVDSDPNVRTHTASRNFGMFLGQYCKEFPNLRCLLDAAADPDSKVIALYEM